MPITIIDSTGTSQSVLTVLDFAIEAFECVGGKLVPTVITDGTTITGDGASTPLSAVSSFSFLVNGSSGTAQTITNGNTLTIAQGNGITTVGSATDIVTVSARLSTDANQAIVFGSDTGLHVRNARIVDNLDRTFTFTPNVGATINFCQGIQNIVTANTCADGGIGNTGTGTNGLGGAMGYGIWEASLSGCNLRLEAAPDHTTRGASTSETVTVPAPNISPLGTINSASFPALPSGYQFTNPSSCRSMTVFTFTQFLGQLVLTTTGQWIIRGQVSVNSGAFVTVVQSGFGTVPGIIGLPYYHATQDIRTLGPGANFTWQVRHQVQTVVAGAAGAQWASYASNISSIGSTV